ncbi:MAG TPA: hypothetical protein VE954_17695 [Oligoflexus sp.]|uniref:hypothetical protein n=1 Tax=Oligoflexus sp. TaxID=1971216 RepID=UPI002D249C5E|nr:hypothetical protein [Oligoflexus sp.]HYX34934.1 hypothetical protein [Oligoflexus sp.]
MKLFLILFSAAVLLNNCRKISPESASYGYGTEPELTTGTDAILSNQTPLNIHSPLGMTLAGFGSSSREWQTVDQMLQAEDWQEFTCDAGPNEADAPGTGTQILDAEGWITQLPPNKNCVGTRLFQGAQGSYPSGRYLIRFTGGATLSVSGDASSVTSLGTGLAAFDVATPSPSGVLLAISSLAAGNPIRDIQVIAPGGVCGKTLSELLPFSYCRTDRGGSGTCASGLTCFDFSKAAINSSESTDLTNFVTLVSTHQKVFFHPVFLQSLRSYKSLGFKDWFLKKSNFVRDRVALDSNIAHFTTDHGAPWEAIVALSNVLKADPWLTQPASISNEMLRASASFFKTWLDAELAIYLEYGGEFWIAGSESRDYMTLAAEMLNLQSYEAFYLQRLSTMANVWKSAFGADASRIQTVGLVNAADATMPSRLMTLANQVPPFALLAMSARFLAPAAEGNDDGSINSFFDTLSGGSGVTAEESEFGQAKKRIQDMAAAATAINLPLLAYGSGPAFSPELTADDFREIARNDERTGTAVSQNLSVWKEAGGRLLFYDKSADDAALRSSWGALRSQQDSRSRLANALREFIETNPCWWEGCSGETTPTP